MSKARRKKRPETKKSAKPKKEVKRKVRPKPKETKEAAQKMEAKPEPQKKPQPQPPQPTPQLQPQPQPVPTGQKEMPQKTNLRITPESAKFKYEIKKIPGAERLMLCFQCGTCTADCPVARFNESYRPRKILRMRQLELKDSVLKSDTIWLGAACHTCVDRCPQDVEISGVLRALRNMAVKEGLMPPAFKELASAILQTGYAYKILESRLKSREQAALPHLPKGNIKDIAKLFNATGFSKTLEASRRS